MSDRTDCVTVIVRKFALGAVAGCAMVGSAFSGDEAPGSRLQTESGADASVTQPAPEKPASTSGASGMRIYADPKTGAISPGPVPGSAPLRISPQQQNAFSTSHQGLVEVPSSAPGGGYKVDLKGRFQSPLVVTIDANGKKRIQHAGEHRSP